MNSDIKRKSRQKQTAEIFTPPEIADKMLNLLPSQVWDYKKTFLDPASGNGGLLLPVLRRKLGDKHDPLQALKTIFGIDILADNVLECRLRLLCLVKEFGYKITQPMCEAVIQNIIWTPLKDYEKGALDYDFEFSDEPTQEEVESLYKMANGETLPDEKIVRAAEEANKMNWLMTNIPFKAEKKN